MLCANKIIVEFGPEYRASTGKATIAGREAGQIMTTRKRHIPEQFVRKLGQADRMLADGNDVAAACRGLCV
jgi:hypothetical protein